jgi:hypothetical protein
LEEEMKPKFTFIATTALPAALALGFSTAFAVEPQDPGAIESEPDSTTQMVTPYIIPPADGNDRGGNRSCADVGKAYFGNPLFYQCRTDKKNYPFDSPQAFEPASGLAADCANSINVTVEDDTYVNWTSTQPVGAAVIKGGNAANTYVYEQQKEVDTELASPLVSSDDPAALSNIGGFCWNPEEGGDEDCFQDETAWAANNDEAGSLLYTTRGNWATYVEYAAGKDVTLFAGQDIEVGTVNFSAPTPKEVTITINLTGNWVFGINYELDEDGNLKLDENGDPKRDNNIKVQDYTSDPSGNPSPGLFMSKDVGNDQTGSINVPLNNFYGVHVDVALPVECPTGE